MNKILVNATSCKIGGARQILEKFISEYKKPDELIILAPKYIKLNLPAESTLIVKETKGIGTLLFSLFGVIYYVLKIRPNAILSFSNINIFYPFIKRITYFHQSKIFTAKSLRFKVFRWVIKFSLLKRNLFIFQTSFVQSKFNQVFGNSNSIICWPGVNHPPRYNINTNNEDFSILIPYGIARLPQKNFAFIENIEWRMFSKIKALYVVSEGKSLQKKLVFIGNKSRDEMNVLYENTDILIITSVEETICLPIFEFACTGKPVLVLNAPYTQGLKEDIKIPSNIIFSSAENFENKLISITKNYDCFCSSNSSELKKMKHSSWPEL